MESWCRRTFLNPFLIAAGIVAALVYSGLFPVAERHPYRSLLPPASVDAVEGILCSSPVRTSGGSFYRTTVSLERVSGTIGGFPASSDASGRAVLFIPTEEVEALFPGRLHSLSRNGGMLFESGGRISCSADWSETSGAFFVRSTGSVTYADDAPGRLAYWRALLRLMFRRLMCAWGSAGALILSLLSGAREYTDAGVGEAFRNAGLSHVLALSGMHLSFFSNLARSVSSRIAGRRFSFLPRLSAILLFVAFAGLSPSLLRALLCSLVMLAAERVFCAPLSFLHVLSAVFLLHVSIRPEDAGEVAFMLSYLSLAGILVLSGGFTRIMVRFLPRRIASSVASSAGAQAACAPVSAAVFGTLTPVGILSTTVVSPLIGAFLTVSVAGIVFSLAMPFLSGPFGCILNAGYRLIMLIVGLFAKVPPVSLMG